MGRNKEVLLLLLVSIINLSYAEFFYNVVTQENLCGDKCKEAHLETNKDIDPDGKYVLSSCQRGCRFYSLVDLDQELERRDLNSSLTACDSLCMEAYVVAQALKACRLGCVSMSSQHGNSLLSLFSFAVYLEEGMHSNVMLMTPDIPENDVMTDPGLKKESFPEWWDSNGFKLPETYFKTVPIDSGTVDYGVSSEYVGENDKSTSLPGSDWLQCASRHTGIPRWLLAFAIGTTALSAFWLCLSPEKPTDSIDKITLVKPNTPSKYTIYLPDEAPLHKKPPPKYSEVVDINDPNLQV